MRPIRFFIALLFGAAVIITFLKLLFFAIMAAVVCGGLYFLFRGIQYTAMQRNWQQQGPPPAWQQQAPASPFAGYGGIQPLDQRGYYGRAPRQAFPRHIEVL